MIPFNKPHLTGKETEYIRQAVESGKISGNGLFTQKCQHYFEQRYGFHKVLLTTSCTDAIEMAAILLNIQPGDEVIAPAFTFVSTVNPFILRGAKIVFADSCTNNPNIDVDVLEPLITPRTKAIIVVHYAGIACNMEKVIALTQKYQIALVEDAAQAIDSYYNDKPLGTFGQMSAFSFHETKNIIAGEGGMLVINAPEYVQRAEIIWEKGTNRAQFFRGEVDKYNWVDIGSSFLPSEVVSAFLYAQLEFLDTIQTQRKKIWQEYYNDLTPLANADKFDLPDVPEYATQNGHLFYIVCKSLQERTELIAFLKSKGILAVFHYISLHTSPFYSNQHDGRTLPQTDRYSDCLLRLPLFYSLLEKEQNYIIENIKVFYESH